MVNRGRHHPSFLTTDIVPCMFLVPYVSLLPRNFSPRCCALSPCASLQAPLRLSTYVSVSVRLYPESYPFSLSESFQVSSMRSGSSYFLMQLLLYRASDVCSFAHISSKSVTVLLRAALIV